MTTSTLDRRFGLGLFQATALNMINMIGIGPFITIPLLMTALGGPQAMLGWIVALVIVICDGMVWSELGAAMPGSGGSFHYLREAFGRETYGPLVYLMRLSSLVFLGADITRPAPVDAVARVMIPVLLIASRQDEQIGFHHAELLRAALGANSEVDFHVLDRGRHGEAAELEPKVRDFFLAHL